MQELTDWIESISRGAEKFKIFLAQVQKHQEKQEKQQKQEEPESSEKNFGAEMMPQSNMIHSLTRLRKTKKEVSHAMENPVEQRIADSFDDIFSGIN